MTVVYSLTSEFVKIDNCIDMNFKDSKAEIQWNTYVELYDNIMCIGIINFARRWAKYMQIELAKGKQFNSIVEDTSIKAGSSTIPDWQYSKALSILCEVWKHGTELEQWKNK